MRSSPLRARSVVVSVLVLVVACLSLGLPAEAASVPGRPAGVLATSLNGAIRVIWQAAAPHGKAVKAYEVQTRRRASSSKPWGSWQSHVLGASARSYRFAAPNGSFNQARVRAKNTVGWGKFAAIAPIRAGLPTAPPGVVATSGEHRFDVAWGAAKANGSAISSYRVSTRYRTATSWTAWASKVVPASPRQVTFSNLPVGRTYEVEVRAVNKYGPGPASARRTVVVGGPAVSLAVTVMPAAQPFAARDVVVTARDAAGNIATTYGGTVTFSKLMGKWSTPAQPPDDNTPWDADGAIPGNYTFTHADAGVHTFVGGWASEVPGRWGLRATDVANGTIAGSTEVEVLSTVQIKGGRVRLQVGWTASTVPQMLGSLDRDPTVSGATLEVYSAGKPNRVGLFPTIGGVAAFDLPKEGWHAGAPFPGGGTYGFEYTGDPVTGCASVKIYAGKLTADCSAAGLSTPFPGDLAVYLTPGGKPADGVPGWYCPHFGGTEYVENSAGGILVQSKQKWGDTPVRNLCLTAGDDTIDITDPVNSAVTTPPVDANYAEAGDTWAFDILANDVTSIDRQTLLYYPNDPGYCRYEDPLEGYEDKFGCAFLSPNKSNSSYGNDSLWGHVFQQWWVTPGVYPAKRNTMVYTTQPECGFYLGPRSPGRAVGEHVSCSFDQPLSFKYRIWDGLHWAIGNVTLNYTTPPAPLDYSDFDPEAAQASVNPTTEGLQILSPDVVGGSLLVPYDTVVQLNNVQLVTQNPEVPVLSVNIPIDCGSCADSSILLVQAQIAQPTLQAQILAGGSGANLVQTNLESRFTQPLVVTGLPDATPFNPVLSVDPNSPACTNVFTCVLTTDQHVYTTQLTTFEPMSLSSTCAKYSGVLVSVFPLSIHTWACMNVLGSHSATSDAVMALQEFCRHKLEWATITRASVKCMGGGISGQGPLVIPWPEGPPSFPVSKIVCETANPVAGTFTFQNEAPPVLWRCALPAATGSNLLDQKNAVLEPECVKDGGDHIALQVAPGSVPHLVCFD